MKWSAHRLMEGEGGPDGGHVQSQWTRTNHDRMLSMRRRIVCVVELYQ